MNELEKLRSEFEKLAGFVSKIVYEIHDKEGVSEEVYETMLDLWREFNKYEN